MFDEILKNVKNKVPLVHNITNYVTVNDCANILLACGGSPIMADDAAEVEEITSICGGLNINIGTLNQNTIPSMLIAGRKANELKHPVILDPVGAGASALRTKTALKLINELKFTVIRGNISEIKALVFGYGNTKGVDADVTDAVNDDTLESFIQFSKGFAEKIGVIVAITGAIDIVSDNEKAFIIRNGHPDMRRITGTGCMLSALIAAFVAANPDNALVSAAAAVCAMGLCGELAYSRLSANDGNYSYRNYIIDAVYNLDGGTLERGAKYEVR